MALSRSLCGTVSTGSFDGVLAIRCFLGLDVCVNYISESAKPPICRLTIGYQAPTKRILQDWQAVIYVTLIIASHDPLVDEVLRLKDGQVVQ